MKQTTVLLLISLALVGRLVPHPPNFTPVLAVALLGGSLLPGRVAYLVPLAGMFASDFLLGYAFTPVTAVVYGCFLAGSVLGKWLAKNRTWKRTVAAALSGSVLFYLVTNFAVWLSPGWSYPHTLEGLLECYTMGLPFFRNSLAGDLFWTTALFGVFDLVQSLSTKANTPSSPTTA